VKQGSFPRSLALICLSRETRKMQTGIRAGTRAVAGAALAVVLLGAPAADGAVSIGQTAPGATNLCGTGNNVQSAEAGPPSYVIPSSGVITAWQHMANPSGGDGRLLVWKGPPVSPLTLAARSGVEIFTGGQFQSFPTRVPVSPGEVLGLRVHSMNAGCTFFTGAGDTAIGTGGAPDIAPGESMMTTSTLSNQRVNVSATLEFDFDGDGFGDETQDRCRAPGPNDGCPSNTFSFGKVKKNKGRGTAILTVVVPGPGTVVLTGKGLALQRPAGVSGTEKVAARIVDSAGKVNLKVRSKGKKKRKLNRTGKVKVRGNVTYTPTGGEPNTEAKQIKLVKRL
jgi:hypothetical protein